MKKIIILSILGLITSPAMAQVTFVNSGAAGENIVATSSTSLTLSSFAAGTAADTYVVVAVSTKLVTGNPGNPITSVTFGGNTLTKVAEEFVDDNYDEWAMIYGGALSGTGDVVVNYTPAGVSDYDAVTFSVASYSDVTGIGAISAGVNDPGSPSSLTDSITTTSDNSVIISALTLGRQAASITAQGTGEVVQESQSVSLDSAMLSLAAPTAGAYSPGADFTGDIRAAMISAELMEQAAAKATTFIVR